MKKIKTLVLTLAGFAGLAALSGCVAYPVPYDGGHRPHYRNGQAEAPGYGPGYGPGYNRGDRDGDGVRDRDDRRPNDPRRY
jgi:hypothetical protein